MIGLHRLYVYVLISIITHVNNIGCEVGNCEDIQIEEVNNYGLICFNFIPQFQSRESVNKNYFLLSITGCNGIDQLSSTNFDHIRLKYLRIFQLDCAFSYVDMSSDVLKHLPEVKSITIVKTLATTFSDGFFSQDLIRLSLDYNSLSSFKNISLPGANDCEDVTNTTSSIVTLSIAYNNIDQIGENDLCSVPHLQSLNLHGNRLKFIHPKAFNDVTMLRVLNLRDNKLKQLPVNLFQKTNLTELDLSRNQLSDDVFSSFGSIAHKIRCLIASNNQIDNVTLLESFVNLETLDLSENKIRVFQLINLVNLKDLNLQNNLIIKSNFNRLTSLAHFRLAGNQIEILTENELPSSIVYLELQNNKFKRIPGLRNAKHLQTINLSFNNISRLYKNDFENNLNLLEINLTSNTIQQIDDGWINYKNRVNRLIVAHNLLDSFVELLNSSNSLTYVDLSFNRFKHFDDYIKDSNNNYLRYSKSRNISYLDLSYNQLTDFSFINRPQSKIIELLNLSHNHLKTIGEDFTIENLDSPFKTIDLSFNNLTTIKRTSLMKSIEIILLNNNRITSIEPRSFIQFKNLKFLDLSNNYIQYPCISWFSVSQQTREPVLLELKGNDIACSCATDWLTRYLYDAINVKSFMRPVGVENELTCTKEYLPRWDKSKTIKIKNAKDKFSFLCNKTSMCDCLSSQECDILVNSKFKNCPAYCQCWRNRANAQMITDCANQNLSSVSVSDIPINVTHLLLDGNNLKSLADINALQKLLYLSLNSTDLSEILPEMFKNLTNLNELYLDDNHLTTIGNETFVGLTTLQILSISRNNLNYISEYAFKQLTSLKHLNLESNNILNFPIWSLDELLKNSLRHFNLLNNPINCTDCEYFRKFRPIVQTYSSEIYNLNHLYCSDIEKDILSLDPTYCRNDSIVVDQIVVISSRQLTVGLSAVLSVLCVAVVIIVIVYKFRVEIQIIIFARYGVRLNFQNDRGNIIDEKQTIYDIFISHSSLDENFLIEQLLPKLEPPFSICLHQRNFQPGAFINEAIMEAVARSKVTLILLSKNFIQSEWCKFEFKMAHLQMLRERQCKVLVVLIDEHLPPITDNELKLFLNNNTYLKWTDHMFWGKLLFALPNPNTQSEMQTSF